VKKVKVKVKSEIGFETQILQMHSSPFIRIVGEVALLADQHCQALLQPYHQHRVTC
jgi:hypothetical protein